MLTLLRRVRVAPGLLAALLLAGASPATAQAPSATESDAHSYLVFLNARLLGREEVMVRREGDAWVIRGTSRLGGPVQAEITRAELRYDAQWHPQSSTLEGSIRGTALSISTTFAGGSASSTVTEGEATVTKTDAVSADTIVLPNVFFGAYAALARRLTSAAPGTELRAFIQPQAEMPVAVRARSDERFELPQETLPVTRFSVVITTPGAETPMTLWVDASGNLVRLSVPSQYLDVAREDVSSAAVRLSSFVLDDEESVRIAASGFNLAAAVVKPAQAAGRLPAVVLVGGSGQTDRDGIVAGIPVLGQLARALCEAGFLVVRYDKRGVGQSGGRTETAGLSDFAEDVRAAVHYLEDRDDVDRDRIAVVGHSEGAWVALQAAARDKRIRAVVLAAGPASTGADLVLEQQQSALTLLKTPDAERQAKTVLQQRIHAAVTGTGTWEGIPDDLRRQADTAWFQSFLTFDPARVMKDVRQPLLIVHGELDRQVPVAHAERLAVMARARKRNTGVDLAVVPGVNHLLATAKTGQMDEYASIEPKDVAPAVTGAMSTWLARTLGPGRKR